MYFQNVRQVIQLIQQQLSMWIHTFKKKYSPYVKRQWKLFDYGNLVPFLFYLSHRCIPSLLFFNDIFGFPKKLYEIREV